jgi:hypothetical protein
MVFTLIVAYGICFGLMNDKAWLLTDYLRRIDFFDRMFNCAFCTGFHSGWLASLLAHPEVLDAAWSVWIPHALSYGFASAAFCYALDTVLRRLEA